MRYSTTPRLKDGKTTNKIPTNLVKKQPSCDHLNHKSNKPCTHDLCKILNNLNKNYDGDVYNCISSQDCGGWTSGCEGTVYTSLASTIGLDTLEVDDNDLI